MRLLPYYCNECFASKKHNIIMRVLMASKKENRKDLYQYITILAKLYCFDSFANVFHSQNM